MTGQRYLHGNTGAFRCHALREDGSQCRFRAKGAVAGVMLCRQHRNLLMKRLRPLRCVECFADDLPGLDESSTQKKLAERRE